MTKINPGVTQIPAGVGEPAAQPGSAAQQPAGIPQIAQTGITSVEGDDAGLSVALSADKLLAQTGLNINLSASDKAYIETLSNSQMGMLSGVAEEFTATVGGNVNLPGATGGQTVGTGPKVTGALQDCWSDFVADTTVRGGATDINALVQWVLRESYMETTKDLYFYAEKVKFFNACKKSIREELTRAREELTKYAGKDETEELDPPFFGNPPNTEFTGGTEVTKDPEVEAAQQALSAAQGQLEAQTSGSGVKLLTAEEKAKLNPPAMGDVFVTLDADGEPLYRVDYQGTEVKIYEPADETGQSKLITRIWGDPHVDEADRGTGNSDWHFGNDSTFILPDGTKLSLNTEETTPGSGIFVTKGIDILSGTERAQAGLGFDGTAREAGVAKDWHDFDVANADQKGTDGGVFALQGNGQWAMMANDGQFHDISDTSWDDYKADKRVVVNGAPVSVSDAQMTASKDHLGSYLDGYNAAMEGAEGKDVCTTKAELETYIQSMEEKLSSVGDDAQLANVDLQNMLQKQQQTMQMMSNIAKMLHDTAMAIIRKIGG